MSCTYIVDVHNTQIYIHTEYISVCEWKYKTTQLHAILCYTDGAASAAGSKISSGFPVILLQGVKCPRVFSNTHAGVRFLRLRNKTARVSPTPKCVSNALFIKLYKQVGKGFLVGITQRGLTVVNGWRWFLTTLNPCYIVYDNREIILWIMTTVLWCNATLKRA